MLHITFFVSHFEPLLITKGINFTPRYIVTLLGHITSSVVWPFDSPYTVCYRLSIWNNPVSRTLSEIFSLKDFGVMTLSLWSHVTSSVTWPLDDWTRNIYRFLQVIHWKQHSVLYGLRDIKPPKMWRSWPWPLGSREEIDHATIRLPRMVCYRLSI